MAAPRLTPLSSDDGGLRILGGLPGGYFVQAGPLTDQVTLFACTAPTTALNTVALEQSNRFSGQNQDGDLYAVAYDTATTMALFALTQSGGSLTATAIGTFTRTPSNAQHLGVSADGSEVCLGWQSGDFGATVLSTADASVVGDTTLTGHSARALVAAGGGRFVATCFTDQAFELWDAATDTLLDHYTWPDYLVGTFPHPMRPAGAERVFFASALDDSADPVNYWIGVLDTTGDTLTLAWEATTDLGWSETGNGWYAVTSTWDRYAVIVPRYDFGDDPASIWAVDTVSGDLRASTPTAIGLGAFDRSLAFCGSGFVVWDEVSGPDPQLRVWSLDYARASTLRQRQSPKWTPSRVRSADLRQRQSPYL